MKSYDEQYNEIIRNVIDNGEADEPSVVRAKWKDGSPATTISLLNQQITLDSATMTGLMKSKFVAPKNPFRELLWIWQKKSNVVQVLRDMGCNVWNEWELEDGTIGRAYGWQLANKKRKVKVDTLMKEMIVNGELSHGTTFTYAKEIVISANETDYELCLKDVEVGDTIMLDQVDWLLYTLKHPTRKYSRRIITTLWCVEDLDYMALEPCVYETHWLVKGGKLHLIVKIRSNDMALGNPYNVYQYYLLHRMIAQVTGNELGTITFKIDDCHVYERHIEGLEEQIARPISDVKPVITLNSNIKSFYDFKLEDIITLDYEYSGKSKYEVAI